MMKIYIFIFLLKCLFLVNTKIDAIVFNVRNKAMVSLKTLSTDAERYCDGSMVEVAYPPDCSKYVRCERTTEFIMDCAPGTWFNPKIRVCDIPSKVESICLPPTSEIIPPTVKGTIAPTKTSTKATTITSNIVTISTTTTKTTIEFKLDDWLPIAGYYYQPWRSQENFNRDNYNLVICFSGWIKISDALSAGCEMDSMVNKLNLKPSTKKILSIGGGNQNGRWTANKIAQLDNDINNGLLNGWDGLFYDVMVGDRLLAPVFNNSFANTKAKGFRVIFSTSHSQPFEFTDPGSIMNVVLSANNNIDYITPQLYDGVDPGPNNNYDSALPTTFADWSQSNIKKLASVWLSSYYQNAKSHFQPTGLNFDGYIQWANE